VFLEIIYSNVGFLLENIILKIGQIDNKILLYCEKNKTLSELDRHLAMFERPTMRIRTQKLRQSKKQMVSGGREPT
jgi:hypothetical protein